MDRNRNVSFPLLTGRRTLGFRDERDIREAVFGGKEFVQRLQLDSTLDVHRGCVNTICWNDLGSLILSGSDDKKLCLTNPYNRQLKASIPSGHRSNIFSAKFLPGCKDRQVVSCSGDGCIIYSDVDSPTSYGQNIFNCHYGTAYEIVTLPSDPNTFMSCGEDGMVRWFDLRIKSSCSKEECKDDVLINCRRAVTTVCVNPVLPYHIAVGCSDSSVRIFDRRMLGTKLSGNHVGRGMQGILCRFCPTHLQNKYSRPTSLKYSANGDDLLVSYSSDYIYLFGTNIRYQRDNNLFCGASVDEEDLGSSTGGDKDEMTPGNPVKRLRLRGDWSDTGPRARPRSEQPEVERPRPTIIQRMSEMLSRWLEESPSSSSPARPGNRGQAGSSSTSPSSSQPSPDEHHQQASLGGAEGGAQDDKGVERCRSVKEMKSAIEAETGRQLGKEGALRDRERTVKGQDVGEAGNVQTGSWQKDKSGKWFRGQESSDKPPVSSSSGKDPCEGSQDEHVLESDSHVGPQTEASGSKSIKRNPDTDTDESRKATREQQGAVDEAKERAAKSEVKGDTEKGWKTAEEERKGIFALGDRREDANPQPRLTKQDSPEHTRSRKKSVCEVGGAQADRSGTSSTTSGHLAGGVSEGDETGRGSERGTEEAGEARGSDGGEIGGARGGAAGVGTAGRRRSSQSMTCSESESDEELAVLGVEREKKSPQPREAPSQPRERVRSEAELRLRELFKTRKQEREQEAEIIKNVYSPSVEMVYRGHRNSRTMIKEANFWGDHYIVSGSDCGHIFFWDRYTAKLVMLLEGDKHVVNCIQPHPFDPILATSGIDYNVKLWAPLAVKPYFPENTEEVIRINELMLEETRDTITVPPSFMLRMLASMNHLRGDHRRGQDPQSTSESSDD